MEGAISVNSEPITADEMQRISGFVHQEDVIMDTMTVREALTFSAMMRLPSSMPKGEARWAGRPAGRAPPAAGMCAQCSGARPRGRPGW